MLKNMSYHIPIKIILHVDSHSKTEIKEDDII